MPAVANGDNVNDVALQGEQELAKDLERADSGTLSLQRFVH